MNSYMYTNMGTHTMCTCNMQQTGGKVKVEVYGRHAVCTAYMEIITVISHVPYSINVIHHHIQKERIIGVVNEL